MLQVIVDITSQDFRVKSHCTFALNLNSNRETKRNGVVGSTGMNIPMSPSTRVMEPATNSAYLMTARDICGVTLSACGY